MAATIAFTASNTVSPRGNRVGVRLTGPVPIANEEYSTVQDGAIVHLADDYGVKVGDHTTIGHAAIIHACEIGNECLIGMGATVLDGAKIGDLAVKKLRLAVHPGGRKVPDLEILAQSRERDVALPHVEVHIGN